MKKMLSKKGFELSFNWLFAIIVGAAIIFLAIFLASRIVENQRAISQSELGKELEVILSPLETGVEEGKLSSIIYPVETRIFNSCKESSVGFQEISVASSSGVSQKWEESGKKTISKNKFIFSQNIIQGKKFNVFSKPFNFPFEVANFLFILPENQDYCMVNPPKYIESEVQDLLFDFVNISSEKRYCEKSALTICFTSALCDININLDAHSVRKEKYSLYYSDYDNQNSMLYAAIFSSPEIYECNLKRIMQKTSELSQVYLKKEEVLNSICSINLGPELEILKNKTLSLNNSRDILIIQNYAKSIGDKNEILSCKLF